jgi:DNA polymerase I-like protein with 3'-5' exonuclease and polymerase domains
MYLEMPTGRRYYYQPEMNSQGNPRLPRTRILNYPVQGLGADLMSIARVSLANRLKGKDSLKLVNTVHDSIMIDFDERVQDADELVSVVTSAFEDVPKNFDKLFGKEFNLPIRVDVQVGSNWSELN